MSNMTDTKPDTKPETISENRIKADILTGLSMQPDYMIWNHPTGQAVFRGTNYTVNFGLIGSPDVIGCCRLEIRQEHVGMSIGVAIGIECKRPKGGVQRDQQRRFQQAWERVGGLYVLANGTPAEVQAEITRRLNP